MYCITSDFDVIEVDFPIDESAVAFDNYLDAAVAAKEMRTGKTLSKYKQISSDEYRYSHLIDTDPLGLLSYSESKRGIKNDS